MRISFKIMCAAISLFTFCWVSAGFAQTENKKDRVPRGDFIQHFDKDGDGKVSKEEFTGPEDHFTRLDKNNDGFIDQDEKPTGPPPRRGSMIQKFDKDGDGKLSKEEFPGPDEHFDTLDTSKDGYLDENEIPRGRPGKQDRRGQQ